MFLKWGKTVPDVAAFPSPGGDVLCHLQRNIPIWEKLTFPSPCGVRVCPNWCYTLRPASSCFRPLAGMCCVIEFRLRLKALRLLPSPGGDVLCPTGTMLKPAIRLTLPSPGGDVLCLYDWYITTGNAGLPSPGGDVLCRAGAQDWPETVELPSPGGDVLCRLAGMADRGLGGCRPLAGMCCVHCGSKAQRGHASFRPLAGMCCVGGYGNAHQHQGVSVPWRGCVVSFKKLYDISRIVFPSPHGDVVRPRRGGYHLSTAVSVPWRGCVVS